MAGYGPVAMVRTPWGDAGDAARSQCCDRGDGMPARGGGPQPARAALRRDGRRRSPRRATTATRVEDLLELSGVSRSAFYRALRATRRTACWPPTERLPRARPIGAIAESNGLPPGEERARAGASTLLIGLIVEQAAASRMCFVEIYAAGPRAVAADRQRRRHLPGIRLSRARGNPGTARRCRPRSCGR